MPFTNPRAMLRPAMLGVARVISDPGLRPVNGQPDDADGIENNK